MKIRVYCDSGASIHSCREEIVSFDELGITQEDWEIMSDFEKEDVVRPIAFERLDWGWQELE